MDQDLEHLNVLSIFHFVVGGLNALFGCLPIMHLGLGIAMATGNFFGPEDHGSPPDRIIGWIMAALAGFMILAMWCLAGTIVLAGIRLRQRRWYTFCLVIAGLECMLFPFGTTLGVFTIIVLARPAVKHLFERDADSSPNEYGNDP